MANNAQMRQVLCGISDWRPCTRLSLFERSRRQRQLKLQDIISYLISWHTIGRQFVRTVWDQVETVSNYMRSTGTPEDVSANRCKRRSGITSLQCLFRHKSSLLARAKWAFPPPELSSVI